MSAKSIALRIALDENMDFLDLLEPLDMSQVEIMEVIEVDNDTEQLESEHEIVELSVCQVCGSEKGGKHSYYGGKVCRSCREFFRRAVQRNYYGSFQCQNGQNCPIKCNGGSKTCQFCRFQKCLQVGMEVHWVSPEGIKKAKKNLKPKLTLQMTHQDLSYLQKLVTSIRQFGIDKIDQLQVFFAKVLIMIMSDQVFPIEAVKTFYNLCHESSRERIYNVDGFEKLSLADQRCLIEVNRKAVQVFKEACYMGESEWGFIYNLHNEAKSGKYEALNHVLEAMKNWNIVEKPKIKYERVYKSPWAASYEDETRHKVIVEKIKNWIHDKESGQPDETLVALGFKIVAFNSANAKLQDPAFVDNVQTRFLNLLRNYCMSKFDNDERKTRLKLAQMISIISLSQEGAKIVERRLPV